MHVLAGIMIAAALALLALALLAILVAAWALGSAEAQRVAQAGDTPQGHVRVTVVDIPTDGSRLARLQRTIARCDDPVCPCRTGASAAEPTALADDEPVRPTAAGPDRSDHAAAVPRCRNRGQALHPSRLRRQH